MERKDGGAERVYKSISVVIRVLGSWGFFGAG